MWVSTHLHFPRLRIAGGYASPSHRHGMAPVNAQHAGGAHQSHGLQQLLLRGGIKGQPAHCTHGCGGSRCSSNSFLLLLCGCGGRRVSGALHLAHGLCVWQDGARDRLGCLLECGEWVAGRGLQQRLLRILRLCRLVVPLQLLVREVGQLRELRNVDAGNLLGACCGCCRRRCRAAVDCLLLRAACLATAEDGA